MACELGRGRTWRKQTLHVPAIVIDKPIMQHSGAISLAALFALALLALELFHLHSLAPLENRLTDSFVRQHAALRTPDPAIVIVDIDEASFARMQDIAGSWPWPRAVHASLLRGILAQRPQAVVYDILLSEPDKFRPESDEEFVAAVRQSKRIYVPMVRLDRARDPSGAPLAQVAAALGINAMAHAQAQARVALVPPLVLPPDLWRAGTINFLVDADGVGRRYGLREDAYGWEIPSLPARVARDLGFTIPATDDLILSWQGSVAAYRHISYADLFLDFERRTRQRPADELTGKIVIIGSAAAGLQDLRLTPIASLHPGVEILATAIDNLKNRAAMRVATPSLRFGVGAAMLLGLLAAFLSRRRILWVGSGILAISALMLIGSHFAAGRNFLLPVLTPLLLTWLYYFYAALTEYLRERRAREQAVQLFGRFLDPRVVKQLVEDGATVQSLSGQTRRVSVLFSDIRGFTTLSESRPPQEIVDLLNRYFSRQVAIIFRHGGTLDKFIGDAIMAFWGAPVDRPDHAQAAVAAAVDMAAEVDAFKQELGELGAQFDIGIGVHTGNAVVGFIGAEQKLDYTAIGDTVNLASRIEGLTKGVCRILVSRETMDACAQAFAFVAHGAFAVKGRAQEVDLFEPKGVTN